MLADMAIRAAKSNETTVPGYADFAGLVGENCIARAVEMVAVASAEPSFETAWVPGVIGEVTAAPLSDPAHQECADCA